MRYALVAAAAAALMMAGCAGEPAKTEPAKTAAAKPAEPGALSPEARQALEKARLDVEGAKKKKALWTTAKDALKAAEEAAKKGDSDTTLKQARRASEQAELGIRQLDYRLTN